MWMNIIHFERMEGPRGVSGPARGHLNYLQAFSLRPGTTFPGTLIKLKVCTRAGKAASFLSPSGHHHVIIRKRRLGYAMLCYRHF